MQRALFPAITAQLPRRPERRLGLVEAIRHPAIWPVRLSPSDLCPLPQLPAGAVHAADAADGPAVMHHDIIIRRALAVEEHRAAKGERHGAGGKLATMPAENTAATPKIIAASLSAVPMLARQSGFFTLSQLLDRPRA